MSVRRMSGAGGDMGGSLGELRAQPCAGHGGHPGGGKMTPSALTPL